MNVFLAGTSSHECKFRDKHPLYVLESFKYVRPWQTARIPELRTFFLDSGAFTFMQQKRRVKNLNEYIREYIRYINQNDIRYFFEFDIDSVIGYDDVKLVRKTIIQQTARNPIPVWHKSRGMDEFRRMCNEFNYVAVGGLASKEIVPRRNTADAELLHTLIDTAHSYGCRIHGLGFTNPNGLLEYKFDSVDSTSWLAGRFGRLFVFNRDNGTLTQKIAKNIAPELTQDQLNAANIDTWIKFQKYAEQNL